MFASMQLVSVDKLEQTAESLFDAPYKCTFAVFVSGVLIHRTVEL